MADTTLFSAVSLAPSLELIYEVAAALKTHDTDEHFKFAHRSLVTGAETYKKEIVSDVTAIERAASKPAAPKRPQNELITMESTVKSTIKTLVSLLKRFNVQKKIDEVYATHKGTESVGLALVDVARAVPDDTVKGMTNMLKKDLDTWREAKNRVASGGHPSVPDKMGKVISHLWVVVDNGFDALGILMRTKGMTYDPTYAKYPQVKNVLRLRLLLEDPAVKEKEAEAKAAKAAKAKTPKKTRGKGSKTVAVAGGEQGNGDASGANEANSGSSTVETATKVTRK